MKKAEKIFSIICDDVRDEVGNKRSLMGLYHRDIILNVIPNTLPHLHFVVFLEDIKQIFSRIKIDFQFPQGDQKSCTIGPLKDVKIGANSVLVLGINSIKIESAGEVKFEVYADDEAKPFLIHRFNILDQRTSAK